MYQFKKLLPLFIFLTLGGCSLQPKVNTTVTSSAPTNAPLVTATPTVTPTASPSATPNPTKKVSATVKPTTKPTVVATSKTVNPIRFEPSSIKLTKKRSELGNLPAVHVYYPGTHTVSIMPTEGITGIWASIFPNTNTAEGTVTDVGIVNIHFTFEEPI